MKFLTNTFLLAVIAGSGYYSYQTWTSVPCDEPIEYTIGDMSARFGLTRADFLSAIAEAEKLWEDAAGKELFVYSESGDLPISLIYDERQATSEKIATTENRVDTGKESAESMKARLESVKARYEKGSTEYEAMSASFKKAQSEYSSQVSYWNGKGGAPQAEFQKLNRQKAELDASYRLLESKRLEVNSLGEQAQTLVAQYNALVRSINSDIEVINESSEREFEQGQYVHDGRNERIDVYEFENREKLVRVLAHELGHALGIEHLNNPNSLMYYLNEAEGVKLSPEDVTALRSVCRMN